MAVVLPVKGSLNWDVTLNAALTYLDNNTTTLAGNAVIQGTTVAGGNLSGTFPDPLVVSTSLSSPLPVNQGGTGSTTQNYVDLTTNQSIGGTKTFTGEVEVSTNLLVGSATDLGDNGSGEIKLANATTVPTTNPTGGALLYSIAGNIKSRNSQGLVLSDAGVISAVTSSSTVSTTGLQSLYSVSIPANDPVAGAVYEITGYGVMTTTGTAGTMAFGIYWGGTGGTALATLGTAPSLTISLTNAPFYFKGIVTFRSTTSAVAYMTFAIPSSATTGTNTSYLIASTAAVTVTTSSAENLTVGINTSTAETITLLGGDVRRMA
jgi:hypothetical protein